MRITAGDLTANMVGKATLQLEYEGAKIEGPFTGITLETLRDDYKGRNGITLRSSYTIHMNISVGSLHLEEIKPSHPVEVELS